MPVKEAHGNATSLEQRVDLSGIENALKLRNKDMDDVLAGIKGLFAYRDVNRALVDAYIYKRGGWFLCGEGLQIDNVHREPDGRYKFVFDRVGNCTELFHFYLTSRGNTKVAFLEDSPGSGNYVGVYVYTPCGRSLKEIFVISPP